jgi:hypothetical protein
VTVSLRHLLLSVLALALTLAVVLLIATNPVQIGSLPLVLRAALLALAICAGLVAAYPYNPVFQKRPGTYGLVVCLPAVLPAFIYYLLILPGQATDEITASQLENSLITDSSSNGIVEVGFSYPIYTPTLQLTNQGLYTRQLNVFLRMTSADGEEALYRGVRSQIPGSGLNVEASVRGMLSENQDYLFNPLQLPPQRPISGRVVFIISNLVDGATFTEALRTARSVELELRDPENGTLALAWPVDRR